MEKSCMLKKGLCPVPEAANDEITFKADETLMVILAAELFSLSSASKTCWRNAMFWFFAFF